MERENIQYIEFTYSFFHLILLLLVFIRSFVRSFAHSLGTSIDVCVLCMYVKSFVCISAIFFSACHTSSSFILNIVQKELGIQYVYIYV